MKLDHYQISRLSESKSRLSGCQNSEIELRFKLVSVFSQIYAAQNHILVDHRVTLWQPHEIRKQPGVHRSSELWPRDAECELFGDHEFCCCFYIQEPPDALFDAAKSANSFGMPGMLQFFLACGLARRTHRAGAQAAMKKHAFRLFMSELKQSLGHRSGETCKSIKLQADCFVGAPVLPPCHALQKLPSQWFVEDCPSRTQLIIGHYTSPGGHLVMWS